MKRNDLLTSVFTDLRHRLKGLATGILGDSDDADDALQDAFCRLWQRRERIASQQEAEALSVTTVHNICIDTLRRHSHSPTVSIDENRDTSDEVVAADDDGVQAREELFNDVERIVSSRLTDQQQAVLRMRDIEGLSFDTIAESLDMQPAAVRVALSRTRKLIREIYLRRNNDEG